MSDLTKSQTSTNIAIPGSPYRGQNGKIRKMTFLGSKNAFLGVALGTISMGFLGYSIPSLNKELVLREGIKCPKKPI